MAQSRGTQQYLTLFKFASNLFGWIANALVILVYYDRAKSHQRYGCQPDMSALMVIMKLPGISGIAPPPPPLPQIGDHRAPKCMFSKRALFLASGTLDNA